jgi:hypothetical protein
MQPTTVSGLIPLVANEHQQNALRRLTLRDESSQIYLSAYERNESTDRHLAGLEGTFTVFGTMKAAGREAYSIKFFKPHAHDRGSFWCSCPDHKFNSGKKNMVCKHICFLVCRVGRIFDPAFFATKQFTEEQFAGFKDRVSQAVIFSAVGSAAAVAAAAAAEPTAPPVSPPRATNSRFRNITRALTNEDMCPICYDCAGDVGGLVACPECTNVMHKECMEVWLERNQRCVYCRSDVWRHYRR